MASLCTRCALRVHRAALAAESQPSTRLFSASSARRKGAIPSFRETTNPELDNVLADMRNKHFIPANLSKSGRHLIFRTKNKAELANNPQAVEISGEEIQLQWMDRQKEIPNRTKLFRKAIKLMAEGKTVEEWRNLPSLLIGLKRSKVEITEAEMGRILRLAIQSGHVGIVFQCLWQGEETGVTLTRPEVLEYVIWALHRNPQREDWSEEAIARAIRELRELAQLLESKEHGGGKEIKPDDLRQDPRVIGVFLELSAVYAWRHQGGKDVDGKVRAYSERLLYNIGGAKELKSTTPVTTGPQTNMTLSVPIWHGLHLAQKILGKSMPNATLASEVERNYDAGLGALAQALEKRYPKANEDSYAGQALRAWRDCIRV